MPNYKVVDTGRLDAAMTATADAIREKTSGTDTIPWNAETGFAEAVAGITPVTKKIIEFEMGYLWREIHGMIFHNFTEIPDDFGYDMDSTIREYEIKKIDLRPSPLCTRIGISALTTFEVLEELYLPSGLKYIGDGAFYGLESLKTLELPEGLLEFELSPFGEMHSLETITLPVSLRDAGDRPFYGGNILKTAEIKCAYFFGSEVFCGCPVLEKVWIRDTCKEILGDPFTKAPENVVIYVEATSKPDGWVEGFNRVGSKGDVEATVIYGQTTRPW